VSRDLHHILDGWDYEPGRISVRIVTGDDGRDKIQMRIDLGVMQMEFDGRPDGQRPADCESWLEFYEGRQREHEAAGAPDVAFALSSEACAQLLREGVQYYHRYLSFWHLRQFERCARDTKRNLRLFAFVRQFGPDEATKRHFDQWRPYVTMMHTRAVATPLAERGDTNAAVAAIEQGIESIQQFLTDHRQTAPADNCPELQALRSWRGQLSAGLAETEHREPPTPVERLQAELDAAVEEERYEEAARLRDELNRWESPRAADEGPAG